MRYSVFKFKVQISPCTPLFGYLYAAIFKSYQFQINHISNEAKLIHEQIYNLLFICRCHNWRLTIKFNYLVSGVYFPRSTVYTTLCSDVIHNFPPMCISVITVNLYTFCKALDLLSMRTNSNSRRHV